MSNPSIQDMGMPAKKAGEGLLVKTPQQVEVPGTGTELNLASLSPQIAAELASGLATPESVCEQYGLSEVQWDALRTNRTFRKMLAEALQVWRGDMNAGQRITKKAEIALEESIMVLDTLAHSNAVAPGDKINAIKQLESLAQRKQKEGSTGGVPGGFSLNINIGGGAAPIAIEGQVLEASNE